MTRLQDRAFALEIGWVTGVDVESLAYAASL